MGKRSGLEERFLFLWPSLCVQHLAQNMSSVLVEDEGRRPQSKECWWSLDTRKAKKQIPSYNLQEGTQPFQDLDFCPVRLMIDFCITEIYDNKFVLFWATSLCQFLMAAIENYYNHFEKKFWNI